MTAQETQQTTPRVFISYSHDSSAHEDRVRGLADRLRVSGIDTVLDQYHTAPPEGWPMWMDREIQKADFVVLVCTDTYRRRVEERDEPGRGRGVLWEAKLIYNHLYQTDTAVQRFVPVLIEGAAPSHIPWPIRGLTYYWSDTAEGFEDLYRHLTDQPRHKQPVLGLVRALPVITPESYPASLDLRTETRLPTGLDQRNRRQMLQRVRLDWIDGVLKQSLYQIARIELGLELKADAVEQSLRALVRIPDSEPPAVPIGATIGHLFDAHGGALLILAGPGTGKTTLLLELAEELLKRAEQDGSHPMPVVFHLSSWAARRRPLAEWLVAELNERSDVPGSVARRWVDGEQIIPLLDGLDEVAAEHRQACVEAINQFRRGHGLLPIAVCSRITDYEALGTKLRLRTALVVQPLTRIQVDEYLTRAAGSAGNLRTALNEDPSLWELLETPLMLWVAMLAYRDTPMEDSRGDGLEERRGRLIARFVEAMFQRRSASPRYTREQTVGWLSSLAFLLTHNRETIFQVENLRPEWLPTRTQRWLARAGIVVASGLAGGPLLGLCHGLISWVFFTLLRLRHAIPTQYVSSLLGVTTLGGQKLALFWLGPALCFGLVGAFLELRPIERIRINATDVSSRLERALRVGLLLGLALWLGLSPFVLLYGGHANELVESPIIRWMSARGLFPIGVWKWKVIWLPGEVLGLGGIVVPIVWLATGLVVLVCGEAVEARTSPNQGTHRSAITAVTAVLTLGLSGGLIGYLAPGHWFDPSVAVHADGLILGLFSGLTCGLIVGMVAGGLFAIRHYVLRLALGVHRLAPLDQVRFLDYAVERLFLRKVGGGYIFIHRVVMEYFASLAKTGA